jgi:hypothetical protein
VTILDVGNRRMLTAGGGSRYSPPRDVQSLHFCLGETLKTHATHVLAFALLAGILLAGTACGGPQAGTQPNAAPLTAPAATASPATATAPTATASAPVARGTTSPAPATEAPQPPAGVPFTFPDGHISFTHPAGWTVDIKPGPALNPEAQKNSFEAVIRDAAGTGLARVFSGMYGDGAAGPATRTILDHAPVPGITNMAGEATEFGFAYDEYPGASGSPYYFMDVRNAREYLATTDSSGSNQILLPNGVLSAMVVLSDDVSTPAFASPAAAKAWMSTERFAQLKAMLLSLRYS